MARIDYNRAAATYDVGRAGPAEARAAWREALDGLLRWSSPGASPVATQPGRPRRIVDIGSGTGIWATDLAEWFGAHVVGVEPSAGMRTRARRGERVAYAAGCAEALPLADKSCDLAWLSTVVHHIELSAAAGEVVRVARSGGAVVVRSTFPDRDYDLGVNRFFPEARRIWDTFPTTTDLREAFETAGLEFQLLRRIAEPSWGTLQDRRAGVIKMRHADTLLAGLTDQEFARGLQRIDDAIADGEVAGPSDGLDLVAFRRM